MFLIIITARHSGTGNCCVERLWHSICSFERVASVAKRDLGLEGTQVTDREGWFDIA